ncbi:accessory Sec system translocase SecA2 [Metabacillus sp. KIGAM252]|uniref:Protein translocase subunit SecA n=1 Tax=Metabacillus flavus TaxID=2823519 RepID=A0ABS5LJ93_9BACI|nr:accessory Sec system translocase SecA2 [Metabacillus flavus]MBS2970709.1 accessory Sec system translocase SecA2 [Metabacillus flavus]
MSIIYEKYMELKSKNQIKKLHKIVEKINALEDTYKGLTDEQLRMKTSALKESLQNGKSMEDIRPHAFALVREAAKRTIKQRHYDVQLIGGLVLSEGNISQMQTGEGKTLVASLPSFLFALHGKGVHVITSNEYLAKRDFELIGQIHRFLGLEVGLNLSEMDTEEKKQAYLCDITYGTGNEFGFDYLRDHMVNQPSEKVQRGQAFAILDEIDSILIDEARTPLIIANKSGASIELFEITSMIVKSFKKGEEIEVDLPSRQVHLTEKGIERIEKTFGIDNLYSSDHQVLFHYINQSLQAEFILRRDVDYIVKEGKIELVDAFTGRVMDGRNLSHGLHQAIEAKEGLEINEENVTQATVTVQNYFRMYSILSGMTGSAIPAQKEFMDIYYLDVVEIPTNRPKRRKDEPDLIYQTLNQKYKRIADEVKVISESGRPVLIGTTSIHQSEMLSAYLKKAKVTHQLLNAKTEEQEAKLIAMAGQQGQVTISTNMAGRGTDILLGEGVAKLGGLHIIGTERHESERVDMQLRGRAGRQGDPGSSQFIVSLEDDLLNQYDDEELEKWLKKMKADENGLVISPDPRKFMDKVQETIENQHFSGRVHLLKLEDHLDQQRKAIYGIRNTLLDSEELASSLIEQFRTVYQETLDELCPPNKTPEEWDSSALYMKLQSIFPLSTDAASLAGREREDIEDMLEKDVNAYLLGLSKVDEEENIAQQARSFSLSLLDQAWIAHLDVMDELKEGIHLRSYGQEDPYRLFQLESHHSFEEMLKEYRHALFAKIQFILPNTQEMEGIQS